MSIPAFCSVCKGFQLAPSFVLQCFAANISVYGFLDKTGPALTQLAGAICLSFHRQQPAQTETDESRRLRGIRNIRQLLQIMQSAGNWEAKTAQAAALARQWYYANALQGAGTTLHLTNELSVTLTLDFILHADLMHYQPASLLHYFIGLAAPASMASNTQSPLLAFLAECAANTYSIQSN